tara:strand:+ start:37621 stop:38511 length:891 start_codon:yes stop_codon:yes gene_type:complete
MAVSILQRSFYLLSTITLLFFSEIQLASSYAESTVEINPALPKHIRTNIDKILVSRKGMDNQSYMTTGRVFSYIKKNEYYQVTADGLIQSSSILQENNYDSAPLVITPPYITFHGSWINNDNNSYNPASILGSIGELIVNESSLEIPSVKATNENLAFYGAKLLKIGDKIKFDSPSDLPLTQVDIGPNYVKNYILQEDLGGGVYLEYHNTPHYHFPVNQQSRGHLILAKCEKEEYKISAFKIPWGHAVYTPPDIMHNDAFLIGQYYVVYTVTDKFSTVAIKDKNLRIVNIAIIDEA